ncbi:LANO_0H06590g1_1 [Lachancea nothofagi CBS 11611]|uniref:non-specific serine/threonine protein kinase n=1 Tax=Lachancea nothofagi CBS 11611 TaxID=1266666 RepID=A0A1G4KLU6_9SACH|nr:LANO_0H06590g1_1 [Lachancea nothofagi CBS 11611]
MNQQLPDLYPPGTALTVGSHQARIIKYLTSGGFAHIYSTEISPPDPKTSDSIACLKRVVVPDKPSLNVLRAEVDAMKLLRGNKHVVSYIDSHAAKSIAQDGFYEVFLLMEYCTGGGLIDFMNTRLQNRFQEAEVLKIMSDISQGIAAMHALLPPLIHRDIKIENVLISGDGTFKVCDFGSVCGNIRPPKNTQEFNYVQHDILKNTTAQYRSPEMIDLSRGYPINEKADIWALGVFLYKLCYYTTPFEKVGEAAILHSQFQFPSYPHYSDKLKNLINVMLSENPIQRPNICQVLEEVSRIQGSPCPLPNFYSLRAMQQQQMQQNKTSALHYSISQPKIDTTKNAVGSSSIANQNLTSLRQSKTFTSGTDSNGLYEGYLPTSKKQDTQFMPPMKQGDPFMSIDRSKLLQEKALQSMNVSGERKSQMVRPQTFSTPKIIPSRSSASPIIAGRGDISKILSANPTSVESSSIYVPSATQFDSSLVPVTPKRQASARSLPSLETEESLEGQLTGDSIAKKFGQKLRSVFTGEKRSTSPIKSRQNTGESVKSSFATLRRGLSRGSFKGDNTSKRNSLDLSLGVYSSTAPKYRVSSSDSIEEEQNIPRRSHVRSSSSTSIVSDLHELENDNTGADDYYRSRSPMRISAGQDSRSSIQKRVQNLLRNSEDSQVHKTAHGYGRYSTIENNDLPLQLTNETVIEPFDEFKLSTPKSLSPTKRQTSVVVTELDSKPIRPSEKTAGKAAHSKPKRPAKPSHLKGDKVYKRKESNDGEHRRNFSDPDIEELEKDFKMRFPSAV